MWQKNNDEEPKYKMLPFDVIGKDLYKLIQNYVNRIDREFPLTKVKGAQLFFLTFAKFAQNTYESILFLCAEKPKDACRKIEYSFSAVPLLRTILEQVYMVAFVSEDLEKRIQWYHKAGWSYAKQEYDRLHARYANDEGWTSWFERFKNFLDGMRIYWQIEEDEKISYWPIPSQMKKATSSSDLKVFFQHLEDWHYRQFSQAAHLTWPHLARFGTYFIQKETDPKQQKYAEKECSDIIFQSITLVLAFLSEIENILHFKINEKIAYLWGIVLPYWDEAKDLYEIRYKQLLT